MTRIKFCGLKTLDDIRAANVTLHPMGVPRDNSTAAATQPIKGCDRFQIKSKLDELRGNS